MGIVLFSASALFDGLQGVMGWLGTSRPAQSTVRTMPTASGAPFNGPRVWHRTRRAPLPPEVHFGPCNEMMVRAGHAVAPAVHGLRGHTQTDSQADALHSPRPAPEALQATPLATVSRVREGTREAALPRSPARAACPARVARPLRVVRVLDPATASGASASWSAGRMVISGRMADVCAELDRLAALEAATSPALSLQ